MKTMKKQKCPTCGNVKDNISAQLSCANAFHGMYKSETRTQAPIIMEAHKMGFKRWAAHIAVAAIMIFPFILIGKWADIEFLSGAFYGMFYITFVPFIVDWLFRNRTE